MGGAKESPIGEGKPSSHLFRIRWSDFVPAPDCHSVHDDGLSETMQDELVAQGELKSRPTTRRTPDLVGDSSSLHMGSEVGDAHLLVVGPDVDQGRHATTYTHTPRSNAHHDPAFPSSPSCWSSLGIASHGV